VILATFPSGSELVFEVGGVRGQTGQQHSKRVAGLPAGQTAYNNALPLRRFAPTPFGTPRLWLGVGNAGT